MTSKTRQRIDRIKIEVRCERHSAHTIELMSEELGLSKSRVAALLTIANAEVEEERKKDEEVMEQARREELIAWVKRMTVDEQEAEAYLSEIIRGVRKNEVVMSTSKGPEVVKMMPSIADVLKAISLRRKSFAPKYYVLRNGKYVLADEVPEEKGPSLMEKFGLSDFLSDLKKAGFSHPEKMEPTGPEETESIDLEETELARQQVYAETNSKM